MSEASLTSINVGKGQSARRIAVRMREGAVPGVVWLGGFKSDMKGTKAVALDEWAAEAGRACLRFDYSGHGESGGAITDGTIGRWLEESAEVFEAFARGPQVLVGSSMGGWIALLLAREFRRRTAAGAKSAGSLLSVNSLCLAMNSRYGCPGGRLRASKMPLAILSVSTSTSGARRARVGLPSTA